MTSIPEATVAPISFKPMTRCVIDEREFERFADYLRAFNRGMKWEHARMRGEPAEYESIEMMLQRWRRVLQERTRWLEFGGPGITAETSWLVAAYESYRLYHPRGS